MAETAEHIWVGIDVGKRSHHACAVDSSGKVRWSKAIRNDQQDLEELVDHASTAARNITWAIDVTSPIASLLITVLTLAGQRLLYIPGRVVHSMTHAFPGEGKTDAKDARVIAQTARLRGDLTLVELPDELIIDLQQLTGYRSELVRDRVRAMNRLRAMLNTVFPALESRLDYFGTTALLMVSALCTPSEIRLAGAEGICKLLDKHHVRRDRMSKVATIAIEAADRQSCSVPGEAGTANLIKRTASRVIALDDELRELDKVIARRFREHRWAHILESIPGMGPGLGADFLVATRGTLTSFATSGHLASYAGLVPVPRDSGRITGNMHRPKRYSRPLRRVFYLAALSSIRVQGPSRVYYERKRAEKRAHTQALLAVARKHVDVTWALIRDDREFTPAPPETAALTA